MVLCMSVCHERGQARDTLEEPAAALDGIVAPGSCTAVIAHEEDIDAESVCAVLLDNIQRIHDIALGFTHLVAVRSQDQSLSRTLHVRFGGVDFTDVIQEVMPES